MKKSTCLKIRMKIGTRNTTYWMQMITGLKRKKNVLNLTSAMAN